MPKNNTFIVDTNVPVNANKSKECSISTFPVEDLEMMLACIETIERIQKNKSLISLDLQGEILTEYDRYLNRHGQPGPGDQFFNWVHRNLGNTSIVKWLDVTSIDTNKMKGIKRQHLPDFHADDHKFLAVAFACSENQAVIIQSSDSLWWGYKEILIRLGIIVEFVHENYIRKAFEKKFENDK